MTYILNEFFYFLHKGSFPFRSLLLFKIAIFPYPVIQPVLGNLITIKKTSADIGQRISAGIRYYQQIKRRKPFASSRNRNCFFNQI